MSAKLWEIRSFEGEASSYIINNLYEDEAIYTESYYYLDENGKRVYDIENMRQEFEKNMQILININKEKGLCE